MRHVRQAGMEKPQKKGLEMVASANYSKGHFLTGGLLWDLIELQES